MRVPLTAVMFWNLSPSRSTCSSGAGDVVMMRLVLTLYETLSLRKYD